MVDFMDSITIAKQIIYELAKAKKRISAIKLQKLLYIVYGTYLSRNGQRLFNNEEPLCLPYGPVFKDVYNDFKDKSFVKHAKKMNSIDDEEILSMIRTVVDVFGGKTAEVLSAWSHREGGAWHKTYSRTSSWGQPLSLNEIEEEFNQFLG